MEVAKEKCKCSAGINTFKGRYEGKRKCFESKNQRQNQSLPDRTTGNQKWKQNFSYTG